MAEALTIETPEIRVHYDREADVLYVSLGTPRPGFGDTGPDDIILRFSEEDKAAIGATVVAYAGAGWAARRPALARVLGRHLRRPEAEILRALGTVV